MDNNDIKNELKKLQDKLDELEGKRKADRKVSKDGTLKPSTALDPQVASLKDSIDKLTNAINNNKMAEQPERLKDANQYQERRGGGGILGAMADLKDGIERFTPKDKKKQQQDQQ